MSLLDWFKNKFKHESPKYIYHPIAPDHVDVGIDNVEAMEAGAAYFRLWLSEMYLKNDVDWFQKWHPAVHSLVHFRFGTQDVDIPHIAGSLNLKDFKANNLEKVIHLDHPMTTLMPFNGGTVEISAGLLKMKGENSLGAFIKVMGDFASLLTVPQLSTALAVAGPVASGIQELLSGSDGELAIGLSKTFAGKGGGDSNDLRAGYIAVIQADAKDLPVEKLWIVEGRLHNGQSISTSQPLTGVNYMLFRLENRQERDDWASLTSIATPFNEAIKALGNLESEKAESLLRTAIATALQSPDLTRADRIRVVKAIKEEFDLMKQQFGLGAAPGELPTLNKVMSKAMSIKQAMMEPEPTFKEIFGSIAESGS